MLQKVFIGLVSGLIFVSKAGVHPSVAPNSAQLCGLAPGLTNR